MLTAFVSTRYDVHVGASAPSSRVLRHLLTLAAALVLLPTVSQAQTTRTFDAPGTEINVDTTIQGGGYSSVDFSTDDVLASKKSSNTSYTRRILLKFDTQNLIPANAVINSAKLYLVLKKADSSELRPLRAYRVTKSFVTRQTNWMDYRDGSTWSNQGGDLAETYATTNVGNSVGSTYTFDVTQLVQRSVDGNFGSRYTRIALVDVGSASDNSYKEFHSTRSSTTSARPRLVISYGSSSSTTSSGTTLKVMQWNIHKTKGSDGSCNAGRIADWVVRLAPQVVSMNEVNYFAGECSWNADQGATLQGLVQQKSGQTWYRKYVNNPDGVGNLILSRLPFASSATKALSYSRGVAEATVTVNGRKVNIFSTHVDYASASYRTTQIGQVKTWAGSFGTPRIVMGDFNTSPGTSDYNLMASAYLDAWAKAKSLGTATSFNGTGNTHDGVRFDYVFYTNVSTLTLKSVNVPSTTTNGVKASDHDPVIAVFSVQ